SCCRERLALRILGLHRFQLLGRLGSGTAVPTECPEHPGKQNVGEPEFLARISQANWGLRRNVISKDGTRIAAQLGDAVWGISDANGREKRNDLEVPASKPFQVN